MSFTPEAIERSRAAVAVSCLRWLQCTGLALVSDREPDLPREDQPIVRIREVSTPTSTVHPLWDRWLDG